MSSAPSGIDVREYVYNYFVYTLPDGVSHLIDAHNDWLVTRVSFFAAAGVGGSIALTPCSPITVAAGACVNLEPNGAFRDTIQVQGQGAVLIVEYWFQTIDGQFVATLPVTVTP